MQVLLNGLFTGLFEGPPFKEPLGGCRPLDPPPYLAGTPDPQTPPQLGGGRPPNPPHARGLGGGSPPTGGEDHPSGSRKTRKHKGIFSEIGVWRFTRGSQPQGHLPRLISDGCGPVRSTIWDPEESSFMPTSA